MCQVWLKLSSRFRTRRLYLNFVNVCPLFGNYLSLEKDGVLHLKELESPLPKNAMCQVWLKLAKWFRRRRLYLNFVIVFSLFGNYLPWEISGALHLNKFESPSLKNAKFGWNWTCGSGEEDENVKSLRQQRQRQQRRRWTTNKFWSEG